MATTVATAVVTEPTKPTKPQIFAGLSFFLSIKVPTYSGFKKDIQEHGGTVKAVEGHEDYKIGDTIKKPNAAGFHSWHFIQDAIRDGQLPDPKNYEIEVAVQPVNQGMGRQKSTRTAFSAEDDRKLIDFVRRQMASKKMGNIGPKGNKIYQALAVLDPRHTTHSWRDRYINFTPEFIAKTEAELREQDSSQNSEAAAELPITTLTPVKPQKTQRLRLQQRASPQAARPPPPQSSNEPILSKNQQNLANAVFERQPVAQTTRKPFTLEEIQHLVLNMDDIEEMADAHIDEAWEAFAKSLGDCHLPTDWASLYYYYMEPIHQHLEEQKMTESKVQRASSLPVTRTPATKIAASRPSSATPSRKRRRLESPGLATSGESESANKLPSIDEMDVDEMEQMFESQKDTPSVQLVSQNNITARSRESSPAVMLDQQVDASARSRKSSSASASASRQPQPSDERVQWTFAQALHKKNMQTSAQFVPESSPHPLTIENLESQTSQQSQNLHDDAGHAQRKALACMQFIEQTSAHSALSTQDQADQESIATQTLPSSNRHFGNTVPTSYQQPRRASPLSQEIRPEDCGQPQSQFLSIRTNPATAAPTLAAPKQSAQKRSFDQMRRDSQSRSPNARENDGDMSSEGISPAKSYSLDSSYEPDLSVPSPTKFDGAESAVDTLHADNAHPIQASIPTPRPAGKQSKASPSQVSVPKQSNVRTPTPLRSTAARANVRSTTPRRTTRGSLLPTHESSSEPSSPIIQDRAPESPIFVTQDSQSQEKQRTLFATQDFQSQDEELPLFETQDAPNETRDVSSGFPRSSSKRNDQSATRTSVDRIKQPASTGRARQSALTDHAKQPASTARAKQPASMVRAKESARSSTMPPTNAEVINISSASDDDASSDAFEPPTRDTTGKLRRSYPWSQTQKPAADSNSRITEQNTQNILDFDTQAVDMSMPEPALPASNNNNDFVPDFGDGEYEAIDEDTATPTSTHHQPPPSTNGSTHKEEDVDKFVDRMALRGYDHEDVMDALEMTTMVTTLAEAILIKSKNQQPFDNLAGVWTTEDDDILLSNDSRKLEALERKHGKHRFNDRRVFLDDMQNNEE